MHRRLAAILSLLATLLAYPVCQAQTDRETVAQGHLLIVYRGGNVPPNASAIAAEAGARAFAHIARFGVSAVHIAGDERLATAQLLAHPEVAAVLQDRFVRGHALLPLRVGNLGPLPPVSGLPRLQFPILAAPPVPAADSLYDSPQGWAVVASGGFGAHLGGGQQSGPWNVTRAAGIRIAILDSGVDANHPDLLPNLAFNRSEVDPIASPSPCDDGSPQDQQGHGTFSASLAAAAVGGGDLIGVAPQATLLNIKVLQRTPAATGDSLTARCEAGEATGLLSWVLLGIQDAIDQHANVISLSLGTLIDTSTGDGAGWLAQFNAATWKAQQAGIVVVAALGNDGLNLSSGSLIELPAQSRGVLPVVASTNPACMEDLGANAMCRPGPVARAGYSNFGVAGAIAAPGGNFPQGSTTNGITGFVRGACTSGLTNTTEGLPADGRSFGCFGFGPTQYVQAMGTSASAPLVAGAAAMLLAAHTNWTAAQVIQALRTSATTSSTMTEPGLNLPAALSLP